MAYPITYLYLACFVAMVVASTVIFLAVRPQPVRWYLGLSPLLVAGWCLCDFLCNQATDVATIGFLGNLFAPCWALLPLVTLLAALSYASPDRKRPSLAMQSLLALPMVGALVLQFRGDLISQRFTAAANGMYFVNVTTSAQQLVNAYYILYMATAAWILLRAARRRPDPGLAAVSHFFVRGVVPATIVGVVPYMGLFPSETSPPFVGCLVVGTVVIVIAVGVAYRGLFTPPYRLEEERDQALDHLTKREALLQALPFGVALVDPADGRLLFHNEPFTRILNLSERATLPPAISAAVRQPANEGGREVTVIGPDGEAQRVRVQRVAYSEGAQSLWLVGLHDVTRERTLEERLRKADQLKALGTLAGGIAHDMNNLLAAIMLLASTLELPRKGTRRGRAEAQQILQACRRGRDLTNNILSYTHRRPPDREACDLRALVEETVRLHGRSLPSRVEVHLEAEDALPSVAGDASQLQQVVANLLLNAGEALRDKGDLEIRIDAAHLDADALHGAPDAHPGPFVRLRVRDGGTGMEPETLRRCLEPLYTTKPIGRGTGLGLAVVHSTVTSHGGIVEVDSRPGEGTTVTVCLPTRAEATATTRAPKAEATEQGEPVVPGEPAGKLDCALLLVEDEEMLRRVTHRYLTTLGCRVIEATDGDEALAQYEAHRSELDLVLLDMVMPGPDGAEVFDRIHRKSPALPVIIVSGHSNVGQVQSLLEAGARDYLQKPYEQEALAAAIRACLTKDQVREHASRS